MELKKIPANTPRYDAKDFIGKHAFGEDKQLYKSNENGRWVLAKPDYDKKAPTFFDVEKGKKFSDDFEIEFQKRNKELLKENEKTSRKAIEFEFNLQKRITYFANEKKEDKFQLYKNYWNLMRDNNMVSFFQPTIGTIAERSRLERQFFEDKDEKHFGEMKTFREIHDRMIDEYPFFKGMGHFFKSVKKVRKVLQGRVSRKKFLQMKSRRNEAAKKIQRSFRRSIQKKLNKKKVSS